MVRRVVEQCRGHVARTGGHALGAPASSSAPVRHSGAGFQRAAIPLDRDEGAVGNTCGKECSRKIHIVSGTGTVPVRTVTFLGDSPVERSYHPWDYA
jgi:hypothetical protein